MLRYNCKVLVKSLIWKILSCGVRRCYILYTYLPCGRRIREGIESCSTVCSDKSDAQIDVCYKLKTALLKKKLGIHGRFMKLSWPAIRDAYFEKRRGGRSV